MDFCLVKKMDYCYGSGIHLLEALYHLASVCMAGSVSSCVISGWRGGRGGLSGDPQGESADPGGVYGRDRADGHQGLGAEHRGGRGQGSLRFQVRRGAPPSAAPVCPAPPAASFRDNVFVTDFISSWPWLLFFHSCSRRGWVLFLVFALFFSSKD